MKKFLGDKFSARTVAAVKAVENSLTSGYTPGNRRPQRPGARLYLVTITGKETGHTLYTCDAHLPAISMTGTGVGNAQGGVVPGTLIFKDAIFHNVQDVSHSLHPDEQLPNSQTTFWAVHVDYHDDRAVLSNAAFRFEDCD